MGKNIIASKENFMMKKIFLDNLEEYDDPGLYDLENNSYLGELPFLLEWASNTKGTIIDLACGSGRITIPFAKEGYKLMGVDIHKGMLDQAAKKSSDLDLDIKWVEQDCTELDLNIKSPLIYMVGNSIQHFHTNKSQDQLLSAINNHLEEDGIFIFGTRFPSAEELLQPAKEEYWRSYKYTKDGKEVDLYTISEYDPLNQIQHYITIRKYKNEDGKVIDEKERTSV